MKVMISSKDDYLKRSGAQVAESMNMPFGSNASFAPKLVLEAVEKVSLRCESVMVVASIELMNSRWS